MRFIFKFRKYFPPLCVMHSIVKIRLALTYGILVDQVTYIEHVNTYNFIDQR